jgi:hypothetical protein
LREIDTVFRKLYEDKALEKISEQQFVALTSGFDDEKKTLTERATAIEKEITAISERKTNVNQFVKMVRKYSDINELNYENVHEFIDRILVFEYDPVIGTRRVEIHYNLVRRIDTGTKPVEAKSYHRREHKNVVNVAT